MAQYDGSIRINTQINTKSAEINLSTLENRIVKTSDKIDSLRSKMDSLKDAKIPTQEYTKLQSQLDVTIRKYEELDDKIKTFQKIGMDTKSEPFRKAQDEAQELYMKIEDIRGAMFDLEESGKAFTLGSETEKFAKLGQQLRYAENDLSLLNQKHKVLGMKLEKAKDGYKKLGNTAKNSLEKINKSTKKTGGLLGTLGSRFKSLALSLLIFNQISKAFRAMSNAIKEGFSNIYNDKSMTSFKNQVDSLKASLLTFKNSFAAAFLPLVKTVIPYLQKAIGYITVFIDKIGQLLAAISGQKTYTKAIKQTTAAIKDQSKAQNRQLSSLDKLNNLSSDSSGGSGDGSAGNMFEEVPIDAKTLDFLKKIKYFLQPVIDYAQKLKDIFLQGFWDVLGDWEYRLESIKASVLSIKDSLIDIWTDPAVLAAADDWVQSVAYMLGSLVGSLASIGLTIAANLLGGIAKYLEQNKERIKEYLISMFNIWEEVNYMFSDLFQSIAYVFEAFASEQGQQLTANIIGIFSDAFMGITELASKLFRDIAQIIIKPFVDNKEAFRTALEGFLGVLAEVTGTIKQGIDDTFDKLNEVYDMHFKPFFDSVAEGLSELVGKFLDFWNETVQPILDKWAEEFDVLWKEHIQPMIDNFIELLGSVADLLKELWENILKPLIDWIIKNVLPLILPILDTIYDTIAKVIGGISDIISNFIKIFKGYIDLIVALIKGDWDSAWKASKEIVKNTFDAIFNTIKTVLDLVIGIIKAILQTAIAVFRTNFNLIKDIVKNVWGKIKELTSSLKEWMSTHIEDMLTGLKETWDSIWDSFFDKVSEVWESIKSVISGAIDGIKGWIGDLTSAFGKLGSAKGNAGSSSRFSGSTTSPSSVSPYSAMPQMAALSKMEFPGYATGQVIPTSTKKHLAWLGDNSRETEVVSPLSTMKEAVADAVVELAKTGLFNGGNNGDIVIQIDGREVFRAVQRQAKKNNMTGKPGLVY